MGPTRFELVTSSLSGTRSNQLSYEPVLKRGKRFYGWGIFCQSRLTLPGFLRMMKRLAF
jgi:hypothetical protein